LEPKNKKNPKPIARDIFEPSQAELEHELGTVWLGTVWLGSLSDRVKLINPEIYGAKF